MARPSRKPVEIMSPSAESEQIASLRSQAVAIDPPPEGAIGIRELLARFEGFAAAGELIDPPEKGATGVRELLHRLGNLADAGYFSPTKRPDSEED